MPRKYSKKKTPVRRRSNKKRTVRRRSNNKRTVKRKSPRKQKGGNPKFYENVPGVIELSSNHFGGTKINHPSTRGKPGIVMMYADWCPHCNNAETRGMWAKLGRMVGGNGYVAAMNCADPKNKPLSQQLGINGYPTVMMVNPDGSLFKNLR